jgi:predicted esterase
MSVTRRRFVVTVFAAALFQLPSAVAPTEVLAKGSKGGGGGQGDFQKFDVTDPGYEGMYWTLFVPKGVQKNARYPLVFALHGNGAASDGHARSIAQVSTDELPVFVIAPQYQKGQKFNNPTYDNPEVEFLKILHTVQEKHPIDPARLVLEGFSMGGNFTCGWAFSAQSSDPEFFPFRAAMLNSTATPPSGEAPKIPYLLTLGDKETNVMGLVNIVAQVRGTFQAMSKGKCDVRYFEVPGMGHAVDANCIGAMRELLATLPGGDDTPWADPKLPASFAPVKKACDASRFAEGLKELDEIRKPESAAAAPEKTKATELRAAIEARLKKTAAAWTKQAETVDDVLPYDALVAQAEALKDEPALADAFKAGVAKLEKSKSIRAELDARKAYEAARDKWIEDEVAGKKLLEAVGSGPFGKTTFGLRARQHLQALPDAPAGK